MNELCKKVFFPSLTIFFYDVYFYICPQKKVMAIPEHQFALITGGSSGIGKAMARELAQRKINVLIVALEEPVLHETAAQIREEFQVKTDSLGIDLTQEDAPQKVYDWCKSHNYEVGILINNAGFGRGGLFENTAIREYYQMMRLNNQAAVGLTYYFLPELKALPKAFILNMSSMEATLPLPYKTVYTGTKNFIYAFSLALREELKFGNVKVSVLCPGPVLTNKDGLKRLEAQGGRSQALLLMPDQVARFAIPRMLKGQRVLIPGALPWAIVKLLKFFPTGLKMSILERIFRVYK